MVTHEHTVSVTLNHSIIDTVAVRVITALNSVPSDIDIVLAILSASLVILAQAMLISRRLRNLR